MVPKSVNAGGILLQFVSCGETDLSDARESLIGGSMSERPAVQDALVRLERAIVSLERAVDKRQDKVLSVDALKGDLKRMSKEREELTLSLKSAHSRSERLEGANEEVSRRLVSAMESVRAVLDQHGG